MNGRDDRLLCVASTLLTRRHFLGTSVACAALSAWGKSKPAKKKVPAKVRALYEDEAGNATDTVWCRRVYLDLAGRIPTVDEACTFVGEKDPEKRVKLVDALLASEDFADYWSMRYCDILRVKSEFPINLWPNAVYVYHRRIRESIARDESWLDFAQAVLSTAGSNFRDAEVNFLRASAQRTAEGLSEAVSLTFLGKATPEYAPYFTGVRYKDTREWKEEIVWWDKTELTPVDFAKRLTTDLREQVAITQATRVWDWLICSQIPRDERARLGRDFAAGDFRLKPFLRALVLSPTYARGSVTGGFPVRRLDAEVLDDVLCAITGSKREYQSIAPEPFTYLPPERKSVLIEDGSIANAFLILFGRPARDSGLMTERRNDVTAKQRLYLFNSGSLHRRLLNVTSRKGFWARPMPDIADDLYWKILSRPAAPFEFAHIRAILKDPARTQRERGRVWQDVVWCLVNSSEFLFRI